MALESKPITPTTQTNIQGGVNTGGGLHNSGEINTDGGPFIYTVNTYSSANPDHADIDQLRRYSAETRLLLQSTAMFSVGDTTVKVTRSAVKTLHTMAVSGSVIITGAPGIGKSGVLLDWLHRLDDAQTDYVFLAAVNIEAHDSAHVRIPATISQDLVDLLLKWPGAEPAYLVIDALDSAKDNRTADTLVNLIKRLLQRSSRWRVVVSIREFDLGHHDELRALFKGQPAPSAHHKDYLNVRHLYINALSREELHQVAIQFPQLAALLLQQDSPLADLLKVPFNLRLAADLLDAGIALDELSPIQSQIQLLDRFWTIRVLRPTDKADARSLLLRRSVEAMIQQRTLCCNRHAIAHAADDGVIINDLLSCRILANWRPSDTVAPEHDVLTFSHHILFDFAVARLLFRTADHSWIERTVRDPQLIFMAYPSYVYHFHHLWHRQASRTAFWQTVYRSFHTAELSEISRTVGPTVAAELAKTITDLEPLLASLTGLSLQERAAAERVIPHLIGSLEAEPALLTNQHTLWSTVAERLSAMLRPTTVYPLNTLLQLFIQQHAYWQHFHWRPISTAARALFQFAWTAHPANIQLIDQAVTAVCVTYKVEPTSARALLSRLIEPAHLAEHGYHALIPVADSIGLIAATDPDFSRQLYIAVFAFADEREEQVRVGGQIMSLTTTMRQQYSLVQWQFAQQYTHILMEAPPLGTQILIDVLNNYDYHPWSDSTNETTGLFTYRGKATKVRFPPKPMFHADNDDDQFTRDNQTTMLKAFDSFLCQQTDDERGNQIRQQVLDELAGQTLPMLLVRRLLKSAARYPAMLGMDLRELVWAPSLLTYGRTIEASGAFISAIFPRLEAQDRQRIEETILSIPKLFPSQDQERGQHIQVHLLLRLIPALLVSEEAKASLLATLQKQAEVSRSEVNRADRLKTMFGRNTNQTMDAIPINDPDYQAVQSTQQAVQEIAESLQHRSPSNEQVQALLHAINQLQTILNSQAETEVHPVIVANAWDAIAEAAWLILDWPFLLDHPAVIHWFRDLLLSAAKRPEPLGESSVADNTEQSVSWSRPATRIHATRGLLKLATLPDCTDDNSLNAIRRLSKDSAPSVRLQVAERIPLLGPLFPEFMWEILEQFVAAESHPQILHALLHPLNHLQHQHGERIIPLVQTIDGRIRHFERSEPAISQVLAIYLHQYLFHQNTTCQTLLLQIADHPYEHATSVRPLAFHLRQSIKHSQPSSQIYQKQVDLFNRLISSTSQACKQCLVALNQRTQETSTEAEQQMLRELLKLANDLGRELFFLSGAFHANSMISPTPSDDSPPSSEHVQHFWRNHHQSLRLLADLGLPPLTHHMLEILDFMTPLEPVQVFLLFHDALNAAANNGYQYEKMAVDLALKIVNKYLSEPRAIFQQEPACGPALLAVLDILLKSGWPETRKLAHQISKVYR